MLLSSGIKYGIIESKRRFKAGVYKLEKDNKKIEYPAGLVFKLN